MTILLHPPFPILLIWNALVALLKNPSFPLLDALVLALLRNDKGLYGRQRLWGSFACAFASSMTGVLVDWTGNLEVMIWLHVLLMCGFIYGLLFLPVSSTREDGERQLASDDRLIPDEDEDEEESVGGRNVEDEEQQQQRAAGSTDMEWTAVRTSEDDDDGDFTAANPRSSEPLVAAPGSAGSSDPILPASTAPDIPTYGVTSRHHRPHRTPPAPIPKNIFQSSLLHLLTDPALLSFYAVVLTMGISVSVVDKYLWLYLSKKLGATNSFLGVSRVFTVGMELPTFYYSKEIMKRIGVSSMLIVAQIILVVRLCGYGLLMVIRSPWFALPSESLHGIYYGIMWAGAVRFVDDHAPPALKATAQGILAAVYICLGDAIGSLLGGYWSDRLQGDIIPVFWLLAGVNAACLLVLGWVKWKEDEGLRQEQSVRRRGGESVRMMQAFEDDV
ncbi:hypothetical protein HK104_010870 [Borealophlyctis nickersoniae]|nr:hypothetical protein HK104_010870 [Borealophlyctis nickersoniae]